MYKSLFVSLSFFALLSGGSCESMSDKMNIPLEKNMKLFGVTVYRRRAPKMSKKDEMVQEVKGILGKMTLRKRNNTSSTSSNELKRRLSTWLKP